MKTADSENPNHGVAWPRNRAHGAVGQNRSGLIKWAEKQEKFQPKEVCFFLTSPFIELTRPVELLPSSRAALRPPGPLRTGREGFPSPSSSPSNASGKETRFRNGKTLTMNPVMALGMK